jgi:exonuclease VII large subunit
MKSLILILICLLMVVPCQAAEIQSSQTKQIPQRLKIQEERLQNMEEIILKERQEIENWYSRHLSELRQLAERRAKQIILSKRMLWTEFIKMNNQIPYANGYLSNTARTFIRDTKSFKLRDAMIDSYFLSTAADFLMDSDFHKLLTDLADGSGYNPQNLLIRLEARKLLHLVKEFDAELIRLQDRKSIKLTALEQRGKDMRKDIFRIMGEIQTQPKRPEVGVVNVICHDERAAVCMVDGVDGILKEGDTIGKITVLKIDREKVEFAKGNQRWVQAIGQPANTAWK